MLSCNAKWIVQDTTHIYVTDSDACQLEEVRKKVDSNFCENANAKN